MILKKFIIREADGSPSHLDFLEDSLFLPKRLTLDVLVTVVGIQTDK